MKELKFEIPIPAFLGEKNTKKYWLIGVSLLWLAATVFLGTNYTFSFVEMLILAYFGLSLIWKLSSRISAGFALFFLVATPILLMLKNDDSAETFAIYAYYFMAITVIQAIFELKRPVDNSPGQPKRKIV